MRSTQDRDRPTAARNPRRLAAAIISIYGRSRASVSVSQFTIAGVPKPRLLAPAGVAASVALLPLVVVMLAPRHAERRAGGGHEAAAVALPRADVGSPLLLDGDDQADVPGRLCGCARNPPHMDLRGRRELESFTARRIFLPRYTATPPPRLFRGIVSKMRQALTFSATIGNDDPAMRTLAVISILALLTISGAVVSDHILTSGQQAMHRTN